MDTSIFVSNENLKSFWLAIQPIIKEMVPNADLVSISAEAPGADEPYTLWVDISDENPVLRYKNPDDGLWLAVSGGGAGGGTMMLPPTVTIACPLEMTSSPGSLEPINVKLYWESEISTKLKAYIKIVVNNKQVYYGLNNQFLQYDPESGIQLDPFCFNVREYLRSGTNHIEIEVQDVYGQKAHIPSDITVEVVELSIVAQSLYILNTQQDEAGYNTSFRLTGGPNIAKTVRVELTELDNSVTVISSNTGYADDSGNNTIQLKIPNRPHGVYPLRIFATATVGEGADATTVEAEPSYSEVLWYNPNELNQILIASPFKAKETDKFEQYELINIPYYVYDPSSVAEALVNFKINDTVIREEPLPVARTLQNWEVSGDRGDQINTFSIICGEGEYKVQKDIEIYLHQIETVQVYQADSMMALHLHADAKYSNSVEATRSDWVPMEKSIDKNLRPIFKNFNWEIDGWKTVGRSPCLRLSNGSALEVPYAFFSGRHSYTDEDGKSSGLDIDAKKGATLEFEFRLSNVFNTDKPFFTCWSEDKGIQITPQQATLTTAGHTVSTYFSEDTGDDTIRLSFVISPCDEEKGGTIIIYINGVASGATAYAVDDTLAHILDPANIIIRSTDENDENICTVDIFNLRIYAQSALSDSAVLNNWIYDMAYIGDQVTASKRNSIFDGSAISFNKLKARIPCMTIIGDKLPEAKGNKQTVNIDFTYEPTGTPDKCSFYIEGAQIDVQGTSSQFYPLKNWKFKSKYDPEKPNEAMKFATADGKFEKYAIADSVKAAKVFCLKIDFMESSGTHNTTTANIANAMYDDTIEGKTPPQQKDSMIRTTIYGRPILVFYKENEYADPVFGGKFNFNYDKDAEEIFGFVKDPSYEVVECFEFRNNTSERCRLHQSEYSDIIEAPQTEWKEDYVFEDIDGTKKMPAWRQDFEARYQYRANGDYEEPYKYLKAVTDWLLSVNQETVLDKPPLLKETYVTNQGVVNYLRRSWDDPNGKYKVGDIITFIHDGKLRKAVDIGNTDYTEFEFKLEEFTDIMDDSQRLDENGQVIIVKEPKTYYAVILDENGKERFEFIRDTKAYRLAKFKTELPEHFNLHFVLMYYLLTDILAMIDSRTKNMFWATWGERYISDDPTKDHSDPTKDNVVIWYPIFYDMDTMMGVSNAGKRDIPYYVEYDTRLGAYTDDELKNAVKGYFNSRDGLFYAECTNTVYSNPIMGDVTKLYYDLDRSSYYLYNLELEKFKEITSSVGYAYNGADNVLWNNVEDAFGTELRDLCERKTSGANSPLSFKNLFNAYEQHSKNWCESIYNKDAYTKFIGPFVDGYEGYTEDSLDKKVITYPDYLYALQGDRLAHRNYWLKNRFNFIFSKYSVNSYLSDYISMRLYTPDDKEPALAPNANFNISTDTTQYVRVKYGSKTVTNLCNHTKPTEVIAPNEKFNDTETMIYGASGIIDMGDLSYKYARSIDVSKATKLRQLIVGNPDINYDNASLDALNIKGCKMLQKLDVQNCVGLKKSLNVSDSAIIEDINAFGTNLERIQLPKNGALKKLYLPPTTTNLTILGHPNLYDLQLKENNGKYLLKEINIENCPLVNTRELVEKSLNTLTTLRITNLDGDDRGRGNWSFSDASFLQYLTKLKGFDDSGKNTVIDKAVLRGTCYIEQIDDYVYTDLMLYFNNASSVEHLEDMERKNTLVFKIYYHTKNETRLVRFFNKYVDNNGVTQGHTTPLDSGIPNNRVTAGIFVTNHPSLKAGWVKGTGITRSDTWDAYYEFDQWGMMNAAGIIEPVVLGAVPIAQNTDFYAMYRTVYKKFTVNTYMQRVYDQTTNTWIPTGTDKYELNVPVSSTTILHRNQGSSTANAYTFSHPGDIRTADALAVTRFGGWSATAKTGGGKGEYASESKLFLSKNMITDDPEAVDDGNYLDLDNYLFKYYAIYYTDWIYPVTFYNETGTTVLKDTKEYFDGDKISPPTTPKKAASNDTRYEFSHWELVGSGKKITNADFSKYIVGSEGLPIGGVGQYTTYELRARFTGKPRYKYTTYIANNQFCKQPSTQDDYELVRSSWTETPTAPQNPSGYTTNDKFKKSVSFAGWYLDTAAATAARRANSSIHADDAVEVYRAKWSVTETAELQYQSFEAGSSTDASHYDPVDYGEYSVKHVCDGDPNTFARFKHANNLGNYTYVYCTFVIKEALPSASIEHSLTNITVTCSGKSDHVKQKPCNLYAYTLINSSSGNYTLIKSFSDGLLGQKYDSSYDEAFTDISKTLSYNSDAINYLSTTHTTKCRIVLRGHNIYVSETSLNVQYSYVY